MEDAVRYIELKNAFVDALMSASAEVRSVNVMKGRKYDRVAVNDSVTYFIEKDSRKIFGAKSDSQYNPRREFGTLETLDQMDWATATPKPNTQLALDLEVRENLIKAGYKQRGRPPKAKVATTSGDN